MSDIAIGVHGLRKHFGEVEALTGADFEVQAGTVFGLLGPNGAGKTTTVRVLATLLRPDDGHAERRSATTSCSSPHAVRRRDRARRAVRRRRRNLTGRENLEMVGVLAQILRPAVNRAAQRAAGPVPARRRRRPDPEDVLGRHAPAPGHRGLADEQAARAVPRRAHHRSRHHQPQRAVGDHPRARERRHHRAAHHAVPGGGRHPREAHRRHRRGPRHRERHAGGAEGAARQHRVRDGHARRQRRARRRACCRPSWPARSSARASTCASRPIAAPSALVEILRTLDAAGLEPQSRSPSASRAWTTCSSP